jgi:RNA 3'-terminal phosphate cyclase (ATP)
VLGAETGSQSLTFIPEEVKGGEYTFAISTAGSAALVLQTILLPLCLALDGSSVRIQGGTHVPWSPSAEYLQWAWLPVLARLGYFAEVTCERAGFFPKGGGLLKATIQAKGIPSPINWKHRSPLKGFVIISASANLPDHVATRQAKRARELLKEWDVHVVENIVEYDAVDRGTILFVSPQFELGHASFFGLGKRGKPAEIVAKEATDQLVVFLSGDAVIDPFLADQILIPLALASEPSEFTTAKVTKHLTTNASVVEQFNVAAVEVHGQIGHPGLVTIQPHIAIGHS